MSKKQKELIFKDDISGRHFYPNNDSEYDKWLKEIEIYYNFYYVSDYYPKNEAWDFRKIAKVFLKEKQLEYEDLDPKDKKKQLKNLNRLKDSGMYKGITECEHLCNFIQEMKNFGIDEEYYEEYYWTPEKTKTLYRKNMHMTLFNNITIVKKKRHIDRKKYTVFNGSKLHYDHIFELYNKLINKLSIVNKNELSHGEKELIEDNWSGCDRAYYLIEMNGIFIYK